MVDIRIKNYSVVVFKSDIVFRGIVCEIEVVGESWEFSSYGVDLFDKWCNISVEMQMMDCNFVRVLEFGKLVVREIEFFGLEEVIRCFSDVVSGEVRYVFSKVVEVFEFVQELFVDFGEFLDFVDGIIFVYCVGDGEQMLIRGSLQFVVDVYQGGCFVEVKVMEVNGLDGFLNGFFERVVDIYDFIN